MNAHTLKVLEYGEVLLKLASCAQSAPGRDRVRSLLPCGMEKEVREDCARTSEAIKLLEHSLPDLGKVTDVLPILKHLQMEGALLEPLQLLSLLGNQVSIRSAKAALRDSEIHLPRLEAIMEGMTSLAQWESRVKNSISDSGEILDSASPGLKSARKRQRDLKEKVIGSLERFIRGQSVSKVIQEPFVTTRNGRYVVPARPEYHREFQGVVQDSSQSGQTLFVEPLFAVGMNNDLAESEELVRKEIRKVLQSLTDDARSHRDVMAANLEALGTLDLVLAKARFGLLLNGVFPRLDPGLTDLKMARHPLLELDSETSCVPIDIGVGGEKTVLVITGPNTGGKTAALKTLGLLTLMVQSGVPVPVDPESRIKVFVRVFADIGDEQSLAQNLSTFSGHVKILAQLLKEADGETLVLLDELGAGTDPQEGSALGVALLEALQKKGSCVVVTTHHNLLKEYAFRSETSENASTLFDIDTLCPTFTLRMGAAGRSYALEIAGRLGLDQAIVQRSRDIIGAGGARMDELLERLGDELDRQEAARRKAEETAGELEAARARQVQRQEKYRKEVGEIREEARIKARGLLRELEEKGRDILRNLPRETREEARGALREGLAGMRAEVARIVPPVRAEEGGKGVKIGDDVRILSLGVQGKVEGLTAASGLAEVVCGGIRMKVPTTDLAPVQEREMDPPSSSGAGGVTYSGTVGSLPEIRLLGKRVPEALDSMERFLDRALMGSFQTLRIVHGGGTGALKKAIREALRKDSRVVSFGPAPLNEGGEGVTVVQLKE